jgi:hypothetical protein
MTWFNSLGKMAKSASDFTGLSGLFHDLSTAGSNDDPWYVDGLNLAKDVAQIGTTPVRGAVKGLFALGEKSYEVGGIARRGIETGILDTPLMYNKFKNEGETYEDYRKRVEENKDKISLGQATLSLFSPGKNAGDKNQMLNDDWTSRNLRFLSAGFDLFDPKDREVAFQKQFTGKFISGVEDLAASTFIDPLTFTGFLGKGAVLISKGTMAENINGKIARAVFGQFAMTNEKLDNILNRALKGEGPALKDIDYLVGTDAAQQAGYWAKKKVTNPDAMAFLFGKASSREEVIATYKALIGKDTEAMSALATLDPERALVLDSLNTVPHPHRELLNGNLEGDLLVSPEYNKAMGSYVADMIANDTRYAAAMQKVSTGRALREGFEVGPMAGRSIKAGKIEAHRTFGEPAVTFLQKTSLHPTIRLITKPLSKAGEYFREELPSGVFNVNDGNSYREFNTFLREANDLSGGAFSADSKVFADSYLAAATEGERLNIIKQAESKAINTLFPEYDKETLDKIYAIYDSRRSTAIKKMKDQGYVSHFDGDTINHSMHGPLLQSESANTVIIADLRKLKYGIDAHRKVLPTLLQGVDVESLALRGRRTSQALDTVNDIFKTSVLMRLGYTVRNLTEAQLSMMAKGFALPSVVASGGKEAVGRFFSNRKVGFTRLSDNLNVMAGRKDDLRVLQDEFAHETDKLRSVDMSRQQLAKAVAQRIKELETDNFQMRITDGAGPLEPSDEIKLLKGALADLESITVYHGAPEGIMLDPNRALAASASPTVARRYAQGGTYHSAERYIDTPSGAPGRLGMKPERTPGSKIGTPAVIDQMPKQEFEDYVRPWVTGVAGIEQSQLRGYYFNEDYLPEGLNPANKKWVEGLKRTVQRSVVDKNTTVYRGITAIDTPYANLEVGQTITEKGFTSTSKNIDVASSSAFVGANPGFKPTLFEIKVPKGHPGLDIEASYVGFDAKLKNTSVSSEEEVLLPAGVKFKVVSIEDKEIGVAKGVESRDRKPVQGRLVRLEAILPPAKERTKLRLDAAVDNLKRDMIEAVNSGQSVEIRTPRGWRSVKALTWDNIRIAEEGDFEFKAEDYYRAVFRVNGAPGKVEPYRVYGKPIYMTKWADIPLELRDAAFEGKQSNYRSWVKSKGWSEPNNPVFKYMRENGYGRAVVVDDRRAGGITHVALPESIGNGGRTKEVDAYLQQVMAETPGAVLPAEQKLATPKERRLAKRATLRRERANVNDRAVSPYYTKDNVQAMINNGVEDAAENLSRDYALSHAHLDDMASRIGARIDAAESMAVKQRAGYGTTQIDANGHSYELPKVFEGASWFLGRTSGEQTWNAMVSSQEMAFSAGIGARTVRLVQPSDPRYFEAWANILNMHFRNPETGVMDPVVRQILDGVTDEKLLKWFKTNEGSLYANNTYTRVGEGYGFTKLKAGELDEELLSKLQDVRGAVKLYIPDDETALMLSAAKENEKPLSGGEMQKFLVDRFKSTPEKLNPINGLTITTSKEYKDQERLIDTINRRVMRFLGSMPEDVFARHPLANAVYTQELRLNIAALADAKGTDRLTGDEINRLVTASREHARQEVERTLFTIVRRTGASSSQVMKLLFPFYAAFENTAKRWGGMLAEDPSIAATAARTVAQVVHGQLVVDQNGNQITDPTQIKSGNANLVVRVPQGFIDSMPKEWRNIVQDSFSKINIPLSSLDVITQGQPGNPGFGPFAVLPAYLILKQQPSLERAMEPFFPAGMPQSAMDLFTPSALRRMNTVWTKNDLYVRTYNQMLRYETYRYNQGQRTDTPTVAEIKDRTNKFYFLRALTSISAPFAISPELDFYQQTFRQFQTQYADYKDPVTGERVYGKAEAEFLKMYPDFFEATVSLSKNEGSLEPSIGVVQNLKKYSNLMAIATAKGDPELMGFLADDKDGQYTFSQAAYQWQYTHGSAPGSGSNYRKNRPANEILVEANVKRGWTEYQKMQNELTAYQIQNGIQDNDPQMKVLKQARSLWVKEMAKVNLDWYSTYASPDRAKYARRAEIMETALSDKNWMRANGDRAVVKNIALYLETRKQIASILDERDAQGGSRSMDAKSNADVAQAFEMFTTQLKTDSPEFESFINRYFANDSVVI